MNDRNNIENQIQDALGSEGSRELASQIFDHLRADDRIYFAGDYEGLVIAEGVDLIEVAAQLSAQDSKNGKDLNSYIVDDAGYCISTATYAASIAEVAQSVVNGLSAPEATEDEEDVFGELLTVNQQREQIALRLERMAQTATKLAAMLRSPQVDERNSEKIGYDAAHSVR